MRGIIREAVGSNPSLPSVDLRPDFLVYIMGPYRTLDQEMIAEDTDVAFLPTEISMKEHLKMIRDVVRNAGFNAFIATDLNIPGKEISFAKQSRKLAKASNAVVFVVPYLAKNEGVCIEIGNVIPKLSSSHQRRTKIFLEEQVNTAMLSDCGNGWEVPVGEFSTKAELRKLISLFVSHVESEERKGNLPPPDVLRW